MDESERVIPALVEGKQLTTAIKTIFDRKWEESYETQLAAAIKLKDEEINKICHDNYEEFLGSVDNLLTIRNDIKELKKNIASLNMSVQSSGEELVAITRELVRHRFIRRNINQTLATMNNCQYVISLAVKANEQITTGKYFSALKTIEQLQNTHLPRLEGYQLGDYLKLHIPSLMNKIKAEAKSQFESWLEGIETKSIEVGTAALNKMNKRLMLEDKETDQRFEEHFRDLSGDRISRWREFRKFSPPIAKGAPNSGKSLEQAMMDASRKSAQGSRDEPRGPAKIDNIWDEEGLLDSVEGGINFAPVYQALHIYEQIQLGSVFMAMYKLGREQQCVKACELV